jgi:hypothetical protein
LSLPKAVALNRSLLKVQKLSMRKAVALHFFIEPEIDLIFNEH